MSINGSVASFLPFTINGLTDASFSNSNLGVATATALTVTSATPLRLARFDLDKNLVSASVDESGVAVLTSNVFDGTQTMKPGHTTNINNVFETTIIPNPPFDASSFTTSGISGYTPPLGTITGPVAGEFSISQTANDRSIMRLNGFVPEAGRKYVYTFTMRIIDAPEAYVSVEQSGVQRSNTIIQIGSDNEIFSDTFTFDPASGPIVFKIYTGSVDPWTATWSSFSLGYYEASINAPIDNLTVNNLATEILSFPSNSTNSESWSIYAISTMNNPSTLGGLIFQSPTLGSAYMTGGVIGAKSFQFDTLSGNAGKVVVTDANQVMSTSINAEQLSFITTLTSQAAGVGQNNTFTGINDFNTLTSVAALRITSSISNMDYSMSVNSFDQLEIRNLTTGNALVTGGDSLAVPVNVNVGGFVTAAETQITGSNYLYGSGTVEWRQHVPVAGDDFEIWDEAGLRQLRLSRTTGLTVSTMNITNVPSLTPSLALGLSGSGGVVSFAVPAATNLLPLNNTWTGINSFNNIVAVGNRLLGSTDTSPTGNFWIGLRGSGSETDRLAIALNGDATTGVVNTIVLNKHTNVLDTTFITSVPYLTQSLRIAGMTSQAVQPGTITGGAPWLLTPNPTNAPFASAYSPTQTWITGARYRFRFSNFSFSIFGMSLTIFQANVANTAANQISATFPFVSGDFTGLFTPNTPGFLGQVYLQFQGTANKTFNWTAFTYEVGEEKITGLFENQGIANIHAGGTPFAVANNYMSAGSLTVGDCSFNYGGGSNWNSNTAGLLLECLDRTEIAVHDAGARVASMMYYDGSTNTFTIGRDMGWGVSNVAVAGNIAISGNVLTSGDITMAITKIFYLYYISTVNHAGFYADGSGNLHAFTGISGVANRLTIAPSGDINTTGDLTMAITRSIFLYNNSTTNHARIFCDGSGDMNFFTGTAGVANRLRISNNGNVVMPSGTFFKQSAVANSFMTINGGDGNNSPFLEFFYGGARRCYMGYASATNVDIMCEAGTSLNIGTQGVSRVVIDTAGNTDFNSRELRISQLNSGVGQLRIKSGNTNIASIFHCNGTELYFLCSNNGDWTGAYNGFRPFRINLVGSGCVMSEGLTIDGTGIGGCVKARALISLDTNQQVMMGDGAGTIYLYNNTGPTPVPYTHSSWANNGYTVVTKSPSPTGSGLGFGASPNRGVIISLTPAVVWNELILSGGTIYTSCNGTINLYTAGGGWIFISDQRCKKDIKDIKTTRSLERIMALKPKTYKKIYPENPETPISQKVRDADHIGFLAQDVMKCNPHCIDEWVDDNSVCDGDDGTRLGIAYGDINVHMVGAIQELKKQNDAQQKEIDLLRQQGQEAQRAYDELKEMVKTLMAKS